MAAPVHQFVQHRRAVRLGTAEAPRPGQPDLVQLRQVHRPLEAVPDLGPAACHQPQRHLRPARQAGPADSSARRSRSSGRPSICATLKTQNGMHSSTPRRPPSSCALSIVIGSDVPSSTPSLPLRRPPLEVRAQHRLLAAPHLRTEACCLPVGQPDVGGIALLDRLVPQQQHVGAVVRLAGLAVARHAARGGPRPALPEHVAALLQHRDDPVGDRPAGHPSGRRCASPASPVFHTVCFW